MPSIVVVKSAMSNLSVWTKWFDKAFENKAAWEYDAQMQSYHAGNVYLAVKEGAVTFEDMSETLFFGWDIEEWIKAAGQKELIYGFYNMDNLEAEFVHIQNGQCLRDYRNYGDEVEIDAGDDPAFDTWSDACDYIDDNLLALH